MKKLFKYFIPYPYSFILSLTWIIIFSEVILHVQLIVAILQLLWLVNLQMIHSIIASCKWHKLLRDVN